MKVKWKHPRKLAKSGSMLDRQAVNDQLFKYRSGSVQKSPLPYCCQWVEAEIYVIFLPLHVLKCAQHRGLADLRGSSVNRVVVTAEQRGLASICEQRPLVDQLM